MTPDNSEGTTMIKMSLRKHPDGEVYIDHRGVSEAESRLDKKVEVVKQIIGQMFDGKGPNQETVVKIEGALDEIIQRIQVYAKET